MKGHEFNSQTSLIFECILSWAIQIYYSLGESKKELDESSLIVLGFLEKYQKEIQDMLDKTSKKERFEMNPEIIQFVTILFFQDYTRFLKAIGLHKKEAIDFLKAFYE